MRKCLSAPEIRIIRYKRNTMREQLVLMKMLRLLIAVAYLAILTQAAPQSHGSKITGGESTLIEEHPYQASLQIFSSHFCGAVIFSEDYVVTAAHCTDGYVLS